jgi:ABC-type transporter MlaC component
METKYKKLFTIGSHDEEQRSCYSQTLSELVERAIKFNLPPPRKPKAAYFIFCDENRDQVSRELNSQNAAKVAKELGQRWKNLSEQEKERYNSMFKKLKEQYDAELIEYNNLHPEGTITGFREEPIRPITGYLRFCAEHRDKVKKKYSNLSLIEIVKTLSQMWRDCDQTLKDAYNKEYEEELQEYHIEMEKYKRRLNKRRRCDSDEEDDSEDSD